MGKYDDFLDGRSGDDYINGGIGDDTLIGGTGDDKVYGESGNDIFFAGEGYDIMDGGEGVDTVEYLNNLNRYTITLNESNIIVLDEETNTMDKINDIEIFNFGDIKGLTVDTLSSLLEAQGEIARIYSAVLARTPDNDGMHYWIKDYLVNGNNNLKNIAEAFAESKEYQYRFGSETNEDFVEQLYLNVLGREPDAAGFEYWINEINETGDRGGMIVSFSNSEEFIEQQNENIEQYLNNVVYTDLIL